MTAYPDSLAESTKTRGHVLGHQPTFFKGQKAAILELLLSRRGTRLPAYELAFRALQFSARVKELRDAGFVIENRTKRVGRQVHGGFRLIACPGESVEREAGAVPSIGDAK